MRLIAASCFDARYTPGWETPLEPMTGVEPAFPAWEASVLPLDHMGIDAGLFPAARANTTPPPKGYDKKGGQGIYFPTLMVTDQGSGIPDVFSNFISYPNCFSATTKS